VLEKTFKKIYLSPPSINIDCLEDIGDSIIELNSMTINSKNNQFEKALCDLIGTKYAKATSTGTSALHLSLKALGIKPEDEIVMPTLTFAATAFAASYIGANITFVDVEKESWNLDPDLLESYLKKKQVRPKLIMLVDLYGMPGNYDKFLEISDSYEIPLLIDSAESLGSKYNNINTGGFGLVNTLSFNLNKIVTNGGGGAVLSNNQDIIEKVSYFANQAKSDAPWFEHIDIGFNYRASDILSAIGVYQLKKLDYFVMRKHEINKLYTKKLQSQNLIEIQSDHDKSQSNFWLTNILVKSKSENRNTIDKIHKALLSVGVESRYLFKPLHLQKIYEGHNTVLNGNSERLFNSGLSLPSGVDLTDSEIEYVSQVILSQF
jgi:dTDP-4-amino-4,6-dideoxygalactose transaminase